MCGIAGIVSLVHSEVSSALDRMVAAQRHRGPDAQGVHVATMGELSVGLGHTRLSILELSPLGAQPMIHPRTGDVLVFNGEIYNFRRLRTELETRGCVFRGHSDTEVLLHALVEFGPDVVARLEGMFAFAFLSLAHRTLLLARDPLGIKPLYLARGPRGFLFASEARALLASGAVPRSLDSQGLASYLAFGSVQEPGTLWQSIRSLPAGHSVSVPLAPFAPAAEFLPRPHWRFPVPGPTTEVEAIERVRATLTESVRDHLVSDVPVGVFLSSGVDSTIMAGLASRMQPDIRAFTVGFPEDFDLNETEIAARTAARFGLRHVPISLEATAARQWTEDWFESLDSPSMDGLNVFVISRAVKAEGLSVALSGQGGDELFGGYPSFTDVPKLYRWCRFARHLPRGLTAGLLALAMRCRPLAQREKAGDMLAAADSVLSLYLQRRRTLSNRQLAALGVNPVAAGLTEDYLPHEAGTLAEAANLDVREQVSLFETRHYMGSMLLRDGDANSMASSLEIRLPMLDRRMIDLAFSLPAAVRFPDGYAPKHILRRAFPELLSEEVSRLGKRGFNLPIKRWMRGPLRERCADSLRALGDLTPLRPSGIQQIWNAYLAEPESAMWSRAWQLCVLGDYLRRHGAITSRAV